jgi:hypothetical protein
MGEVMFLSKLGLTIVFEQAAKDALLSALWSV